MDILPGLRIIRNSILVKKPKALVIADTQLGIEESIRNRGVLIPSFQLKDISEQLLSLISIAEPETIIINGDIKHEFGSISKAEWDVTIRLLDMLKLHCNVVLVKGNHDTLLAPIAAKRGLQLADHISLDGIYICHGHRIPEDGEFRKARIVIIGHEHPAITLKEENRKEKFKCFLKGKYKDKVLIVLPSFNEVTTGTDILTENLLSPFLQEGISDFEVIVSGRKPLLFGKVAQL